MSQPDFIVPPPGLVPDAPEPETPERTVQAPDRLPVFRPGTPVAPPSGIGRAAPPALPVPPVPPVAAAAAPRAWRLRSADGVEFVVRDRVVAGRDPRPEVVGGDAAPVAILDPARSMSKTHALLEVDGDRLLATDLRSTNGVRVWPDGGDPVELEPGVPTAVPADAVLLLGDVAFLVDRGPDPDSPPPGARS